jgi:hypothetical protein
MRSSTPPSRIPSSVCRPGCGRKCGERCARGRFSPGPFEASTETTKSSRRLSLCGSSRWPDRTHGGPRVRRDARASEGACRLRSLLSSRVLGPHRSRCIDMGSWRFDFRSRLAIWMGPRGSCGGSSRLDSSADFRHPPDKPIVGAVELRAMGAFEFRVLVAIRSTGSARGDFRVPAGDPHVRSCGALRKSAVQLNFQQTESSCARLRSRNLVR